MSKWVFPVPHWPVNNNLCPWFALKTASSLTPAICHISPISDPIRNRFKLYNRIYSAVNVTSHNGFSVKWNCTLRRYNWVMTGLEKRTLTYNGRKMLFGWQFLLIFRGFKEPEPISPKRGCIPVRFTHYVRETALVSGPYITYFSSYW